VTQHSAVMAY